MTATVCMTALVLALLIGPIVALYEMAAQQIIYQNAYALGLIFVCTLIFASMMSAVSKAKRHELLAASAAYAAVLVVFLGNVTNTQPQ